MIVQSQKNRGKGEQLMDGKYQITIVYELNLTSKDKEKLPPKFYSIWPKQRKGALNLKKIQSRALKHV